MQPHPIGTLTGTDIVALMQATDSEGVQENDQAAVNGYAYGSIPTAGDKKEYKPTATVLTAESMSSLRDRPLRKSRDPVGHARSLA